MAKNSTIEWTNHTFNPWYGCTRVSEGCRHCFAESISTSFKNRFGEWGVNGSRVVASKHHWKQPSKWNFQALSAGRPQRVLCASMADVFEGQHSMPKAAWNAVEHARTRLIDLIARTRWLDWLLLTKYPENATILWNEAASQRGIYQGKSLRAFRNLWIGTSVENCGALHRIESLRNIPAAGRFLCIDPLLEDLKALDLTGINWVIVGGEFGKNARPMHIDWVRRIRDQCVNESIPFFFSQWGAWYPVCNCGLPHTRPCPMGQNVLNIDLYLGLEVKDHICDDCGNLYQRRYKKDADRKLDGRTWDEIPEFVTRHLPPTRRKFSPKVP